MERSDLASRKAPGICPEMELWERRDEPAVRSELADRYLAFAKSIAIRYRGEAETTEDLIQIASLGLMNAIARFDPANGTPFIGFASPTIHGELKRHFRDRVSGMRVPRPVYSRIGVMESVVADLRASMSEEPTTDEIAEAMGCSPAEVLEARDAVQTRNPVSFSEGGEDDEGPVEEHLGFEDPAFSLAEDRISALGAIRSLDDQDRRILVWRFRDELSQAEIAERLGCSQMHVSRCLKSILEFLNEEVAEPVS